MAPLPQSSRWRGVASAAGVLVSAGLVAWGIRGEHTLPIVFGGALMTIYFVGTVVSALRASS